MENYTCPCCGYKTLETEHDNDICPICYWEDDYLQFQDIDLEGGTNCQISLRQGQQNYIKFGACDKNMLQYVRKPNSHDIRDKSWNL